MVGVSMVRLIVALILGGLIGLERELKHRPAGLRTNLFICLGAAMYTAGVRAGSTDALPQRRHDAAIVHHRRNFRNAAGYYVTGAENRKLLSDGQ